MVLYMRSASCKWRLDEKAELKSFMGKVCESGGSGNKRHVAKKKKINAGFAGYLEL